MFRANRAIPGPSSLPIHPDTRWSDFGYTPGPRYPNPSDGYYVMLKSLTPGERVLTFAAEVDNRPGQLVTFPLTVIEDDPQ